MGSNRRSAVSRRTPSAPSSPAPRNRGNRPLGAAPGDYAPRRASGSSGYTGPALGGPVSYSGRDYRAGVKVGAVSQSARADRARRTYRSWMMKTIAVFSLIGLLVIGVVALYWSDAFAIKQVTVSGVEHLTGEEMSALANIPSDTTLLRVDASGIRANIMRDAWVEDVDVQRVFPDTLNLAVTEREIGATVVVGVNEGQGTQRWALASDGMWLCPIPDQQSEAGRSISQKIYEDAASVFEITDVAYGVVPEIGSYCSDDSINNAMQVVTGLTTELKDQVVKVSATSTETTTLTLESGIEIAFGKAEDIRTKERICLEIMEQNQGSVSYINVRVVNSPTWRAL